MRIATGHIVPLGYGKYFRADSIVGLEPLEEGHGPGKRTKVYIEDLPAPLIVSRSEGAILRDLVEMPKEVTKTRELYDMLSDILDTVAPQLTVVPAPPLNEAFEHMRGTPTLLGWRPTSRRLVIPVGARPTHQMLVRVTRVSATEFQQEELGYVCFVPLIGAQGWADDKAARQPGEDTPPGRLRPDTQERHHEHRTPHGQTTP